jgi:hypothetical protein
LTYEFDGIRVDGVAGEQESIEPGAGRVHGERSEDDGWTREAGGGGAIAQQRIAHQLAGQERGRVAQVGVAGPRRANEADVGQPAGNRRDADVSAAADVHLAQDRWGQTRGRTGDRPGDGPGTVPGLTPCAGSG